MHSQKYCAAPVVEEEWIKMNEVVKKLLKIMKMCDGSNDPLLHVHPHGAIHQRCN